MFIKNLKFYGGVLCVALLASGCSVIDLGSDDHAVVSPTNSCRLNPASCMYEGSYEPGERAYAEAEAQRLNRASLDRLRRSGVR